MAQVSKGRLSGETVRDALTLLEIDERGLSAPDRNILAAIALKFNGGPVGLNTIAAALSEDQATIEEVYEPYLIQCGFLERTPRGRILTPAGYRHLGYATPEDLQAKMAL